MGPNLDQQAQANPFLRLFFPTSINLSHAFYFKVSSYSIAELAIYAWIKDQIVSKTPSSMFHTSFEDMKNTPLKKPTLIFQSIHRPGRYNSPQASLSCFEKPFEISVAEENLIFKQEFVKLIVTDRPQVDYCMVSKFCNFKWVEVGLPEDDLNSAEVQRKIIKCTVYGMSVTELLEFV